MQLTATSSAAAAAGVSMETSSLCICRAGAMGWTSGLLQSAGQVAGSTHGRGARLHADSMDKLLTYRRKIRSHGACHPRQFFFLGGGTASNNWSTFC